MKVLSLSNGVVTQVNALEYSLPEQVNSTSTGSGVTLPTITAPIMKLTNAGLVSITNISVPATINKATIVNKTGGNVTVSFGGGSSTSIWNSSYLSAILIDGDCFSVIYSGGQWVVDGLFGSFASLTTSNQVFSGLQQEFTNKVWFNGGIRLVDQVSTFTSVDFVQSASQTMDTWYTMPPDLGTAGQFLKNDGTGVLSWATPAGGGGGSLNTTSTTVDFGAKGDYVTATVSASWVTSTSVISLTITPNLTDHDYEDVLIEELKCTIGAIVNGVSFDIHVHAPNETWGRYIIKAQGA